MGLDPTGVKISESGPKNPDVINTINLFDLIIVNYFLPGELAPGRSETSALSQRRKDEETQCDHIL